VSATGSGGNEAGSQGTSVGVNVTGLWRLAKVSWPELERTWNKGETELWNTRGWRKSERRPLSS